MSDTKISGVRLAAAQERINAYHQQPAELVDASVVEQIAQQWDGCQYDAPGEMVDIGAAIRRAGKRLSAEMAEQQGVDAHTLWAMAQLAPGEGIEDGVQRIEKALAATGKQQVGEVGDSASRLIDAIEGECDGLVISHETAAAILDHVRLGDPWRDAVFSEWALTFIDPQSEVPAEILRAVINWNVRTALDPSASSDAAALVASGKQVGEVQGDALVELADAWRSCADKHELSALEADSIGGMGATVWQHEIKAEVFRQAADELQAALAARQPGELIAQKVGDYRVTVSEDTITVSHGRDIVFAYSAGDAEPIMARQPGAQVPVRYEMWKPGNQWEECTKEEHEDWQRRGGGKTSRALYAAPPTQGMDLGQFIALAKFGEEFAFSAEKQPHSRVVYSQASRLLVLIDQRDATPGVGNG